MSTRGTCLTLENVQVRFNSVATFWFAQREPKSLHKTHFTGDCGLRFGPRWGAYSTLPHSLARFKRKKGRMEMAGQSEEGEGR